MVQETLLINAAAPVIERIKKDKERASQRVLPILECLEEHLFSPECNVNFLKLSAGIRDNSVVIHFHSDMGVTPKVYLQGCRMETAERLLLETKLKVWQIGDLVGFSSLGVFSKAFFSWAGIRPSTYRKLHRTSRAGGPENPKLFSQEHLEAAFDGRLPPAEANALIERLLALYPAGRTPHDAGGPGRTRQTDPTVQGSPRLVKTLHKRGSKGREESAA